MDRAVAGRTIWAILWKSSKDRPRKAYLSTPTAATLKVWDVDTTGIGAGRHRSSRTWRNRRLQKPPRPEQKQPLRGGAERRPNRNQRKPLRKAADPRKLNERAATLQEKRGLSRYGERYKGEGGGGDGRCGKIARKEKKKGNTARGALRRKENKGGHGTGSTTKKGKQRETLHEEHCRKGWGKGPQQETL
ncbi:hypothetical protein NDU88_010273 [Pleurodeles waltl]|uniref:Uncharacterized protein n=1 Tax=Pleurodeles waltl TaxID=8319 RepID=A0AAV7QU05_PLEWA|nr:hypothetical protein NDU88_010273 [Pleurodeles waltl]